MSNCVILFGVNVVYWWRARTEEMHLSRDPLYVEYALMMNDKSALAFLGKWFPAFHGVEINVSTLCCVKALSLWLRAFCLTKKGEVNIAD